MTAPDHPTREQVEAAPHRAAALLLAAARVDPTLRAAAEQVQDALIALDAEVRALGAELEATRSASAPLPWLTGAVPDETARVVADVKAEAVWLVLHMQANGTREDIQSALRTLRLVWGDPQPVGAPTSPTDLPDTKSAEAARAPQLTEQPAAGDVGAEARGVLWMSLRYALGRRTYAVQEVASAIAQHAHRLAPWQRERMAQEIERELGYDTDAAAWGSDAATWRQAISDLRAPLPAAPMRCPGCHNALCPDCSGSGWRR